MSFRGQASWAKMTSPRGKLSALVGHPMTKVNKAEELTYLSTNIDSKEEYFDIGSDISIKNLKRKT